MTEQEQFKKMMSSQMEEIGVQLTEEKISHFYRYFELITQWNKVMNLTAITEMDQVITKHFVDSLTLIKAVPDLGEREYRLIDVGTGAGFPGIPLKIVFPQLKITLLDSLQKRVKFLQCVFDELRLEEIEAVHGRAEDFGRQAGYREKYDLCVSRAVANLSTLSELCLPFVKKGGKFISYKSGKGEEELENGKSAISKLSGHVDGVISFQLPNVDQRTFLVIRKFSEMNKKYPRKAGMPAKEPLE